MLDLTNSISSENFTSEDDGCELFKKMVVFFEDQKFCDVTLNSSTEGIQVKAHRMVLAAASEYFMAMFGGSLKEADAGEVNFDQIDGRTLKSVICFIYTKSIELKTDTVENIVKASHLFQLKKLEVACCEYLSRHLDICNCLGFAFFAEHYNYKELYETAFAFALENFMKLRSFGEFFLLEAKHLINLISRDDLRVSSEEFVFHSIIAWIDYDTVNRNKYLESLVKCLRFKLLQPQFIAGIVEAAVCNNSSVCRDLIFEAYKWHSLPCQALDSKQQIALRSIKDVIIAISGWSSAENILNVGLYYDGYDKWIYTTWPGPPERRFDFSSTALGDNLIIAGGKFASGEVSNHVDCLDLRTLEWTQLSPLIIKRHSCGLAALNGCIYAVGGMNSSSLDSVEKWDPLTKVWEIVASLPEPDSKPYVGCMNELLCVIKAQASSNSVGRFALNYNPVTDKWFECEGLFITGNLMGMATLSINEVDNLICISTTDTYSTNLETKVTTITASPNNFCSQAYKVAALRNRLILYNKTKFREYGLYGILKIMPTLQVDPGRVVLISN